MFITQTEMFDLFTRKEELHDDLIPYYRKAGEGYKFATLRHPFVFSVPHFETSNAYINKQYEVRKKCADEAIANGDYTGYISIHENPYRVNAFKEVCDRMSDEDYWSVLSDIWQLSENIWQNKQGWIKLLKSKRPGKKHFMNEEEHETFASMPDVITSYRGYIPGKNMTGLSYSLSKEKAEWFANRFQRLNGDGKVIKISIPKKKVFAYMSCRNEQELIIL